MDTVPVTSRRWSLLVLVLFVIPLACARDGRFGCAPDKGPGGVSIVLALPKGEVEWVSSVDVSFDHPMVALGAATTKSGPVPLKLKPGVPGRFTWIGTRTASFIPERPLAFATRYQVTVPAGNVTPSNFEVVL